MSVIKLLDEKTAQKIAAGEVVEKPASVVKELVENSIDAGATHISVEIKDGGISYIRVTDNGCGIAREDVNLAFMRHATSKLESAEDLFEIRHMGFRGEALYSIAAVSKLEMTTKTREDAIGTRVVIEGGSIQEVSERGCPNGTTIVVKELFYNTPARLKFLSKPVSEASAIASMLARLILARPDISCKYISSGKTVFHSLGDSSLKNAVFAVYGREAADNLIEVSRAYADISVKGYVSTLDCMRSTRTQQVLFVNERPISNIAVSRSIEDAYGTALGQGKYPVFVLDLKVPYSFVDVNVHPNKLTVRFADEQRLRRLVYEAVASAMGKALSAPVIMRTDRSAEPEIQIINQRAQQSDVKPESTGEPHANTVQTSTQSTIDSFLSNVRSAITNSDPVEQAINYAKVAERPMTLRESRDMQVDNETHTETELTRNMGEATVPAIPAADKNEAIQHTAASMVGVAFDTYIILEDEERLYFIDQHAAHERLLFDRYTKEVNEGKVISQPLLLPETFDVTYEEKNLLDENLDMINALGFEVCEYGRLTYRIDAVPLLLGATQGAELIREVLKALVNGKNAPGAELKRQRLMSMACRHAVKGGDKLTKADIEALLMLMEQEKTPLSCPHGRPVVMVLDRYTLEKHFRRVDK